MATAALLTDRSIIEVTGIEARSFLQGLICNDMASCNRKHALYAALLTPQGKILFEFLTIETGTNCFWIDCFSSHASEFLKRLQLYRLRAKIDIRIVPELDVAAIWNADVALIPEVPQTSVFTDPRLADLGRRMIGPRPLLEKIVAQFQAGDYAAFRLHLGIPDSADIPPDAIFPLDAGLEELSGISFKKGCYIGQEVTSRMKHRATARRRFLIAESEDAWPAPGTSVLADGREVGSLATGKGRQGLALIRLDRWTNAVQSGSVLTAADKGISLKKPTWLGFDVSHF